MKKTLGILFALLALLPGLLSAQTAKAEAKLVFYDDDTQIVITDAKGTDVTPNEGLSLQPGWVVKTKKTSAEIKLQPNGSILKLANNTTFRIDALKDLDSSKSNDFALLNGKVRAVAAKLTGATAPGYNVRTQTANCGVRGTDFAMLFDPANQKDWVCVQEGLVDFTNTVTGQTVPVASNQFANTFDKVFQAGAVTPDRLKQLFGDIQFQKLNPAEVPGHEVQTVAAETSPAPSPTPSEAPQTAQANPDDPIYNFLKNFLGLQIGSVTINGTTYSKAVISPTINVDKLKLALYLPVVYTKDLFNPSDWYQPGGNNEWSFGSDSSWGTDWLGRVKDFGTDLALKIKSLEYGDPGFDNFYVKVGNLNSMTLGHGSIVRNFANDQEFPAIRKIAINAGIHANGFGVEALVDDLANPQIVGGRLSFDIIKDQTILGLTTVSDLAMVSQKDLSKYPGYTTLTPQDLGDPALLVGGLDAQLFKLDIGAVRTIAFADFNVLTAAYRNSVTGTSIASGLATKTLWDNGLKSWGIEAGAFGNILIADYRVTFQAAKGLYTNELFQGNYYRNRLPRAIQINSYLSSTTAAQSIDDTTNMGIYGEAGFNIFGIVVFNAGYKVPLQATSSGINFAGPDYLKLKLDLLKDKVPIVKIYGSITYERTNFLTSLRNGVSLFDANTVLKGEAIYGLAKGLDLAIGVVTNVILDANGNVQYDASGLPKVAPSISLETRVSF